MFDITLPNIRRTIAVAAGQTILSAALDASINYPHGCKSGRCGRCKSRLVEGQVDLLDHSRFALTADERAAGLILACRAIPTADASVVWLGEGRADIHRAEPADQAGI